MAEVYGEKPKVFTKEWWPYFWLYYKWHTVAFIFVILLAGTWISDCARREKYDLMITYLGRTYYEAQLWNETEKLLEPDINDADGDGEKNIGLMNLVISEGEDYNDQNYASYIKHDVSFSEDLSYVYIYDSTELGRALTDGIAAGCYAKASEWLNTDVPDEKFIYTDGTAYAVSLRDSKILKKAGIDCEKLYILVRTDAGTPQKNNPAQRNAVIAANNLIK